MIKIFTKEKQESEVPAVPWFLYHVSKNSSYSHDRTTEYSQILFFWDMNPLLC